MKPQLDWSAYEDAGMGDAYADIPKQGGDFAKAVAVCINSRRCEAENKGVMCSSFRVSQEPALSTGGRVRMLKAALNADPVDQALAEPQLVRAMDLWIACKGCKRECENNVDMALIKAEYLAQRAQRPAPRAELACSPVRSPATLVAPLALGQAPGASAQPKRFNGEAGGAAIWGWPSGCSFRSRPMHR